jgi:predicted ATPase
MPAPFFTVMAHTTLGFVLFSRAELERARTHLEHAAAAWQPRLPRLALDQAVVYRGILALTLLLLGHPAEARTGLQQLLDYGASLADDPFSLAYAHNLAAQFHATAADRAAARRHSEQALALARAHGFPLLRATATVVQGWALCDAGVIREGLALHAELGHRVTRSLFDALLAETLLEQGQVESALETVASALAFAAESGEARHLAELHRLRGMCLLRRNGRSRGRNRAPAARAFHTAIDIAQRQRARLWEARAAAALDAIESARPAVRAFA